MKPIIYVALLLVFLCQSILGQNSDDVMRTPDEDANDDADKKDAGGSNKVVILGVTLSASVMVAVAGIFIGKYFHVEKLLCCCCKKKTADEEKLDTNPLGDAGWYGSEVNKESNMFMTGRVNGAYSANENSKGDEKKEEIKKQSESKRSHGPRRAPVLPSSTKHKKSKATSMTVNIEPVGFGACTTHIAADGSLVKARAVEEKFNQTPATESQNISYNSETSYKTAASQHDDILF
ncbi:uncharacterized protein LOC100185162 [Ciona intestinalis]